MNVGLIITIIIGLSVLVEFLTQIVKDVLDAIKTGDKWTIMVKVVAIVFGVGTAFIADFELLPLLGYETMRTWGLVTLVGLTISAGSTKVYDLTKRLKGIKHSIDHPPEETTE